MEALNARVIHMHDIEANWKLASTFVPCLGEPIIYDPDENCTYSRMKVGDGIHNVNELPFLQDNTLFELIKWEGDIGYIDSGRIE